MMNELDRLRRRLARDKEARQQAETLLEQKSWELYKVNQELANINTRLEEQVSASIEAGRRLAVQYDTAKALAQSVTLEQAAHKILQAVGKSLGVQCGGLWKEDSQKQVLVCMEVWEKVAGQYQEFTVISSQYTFAKGYGLPGRVWKTGKPHWIMDIVTDPNFPRALVAAKVHLHGAFGFPIQLTGGIFGVIEFFSSEIWTSDDKMPSMVEAITQQIDQFVERKSAEANLAFLVEKLEHNNEELAQARDKALEAARLKSEFLATMSHEIRTPMNGIIGMTEFLVQSPLTEDQRECAETVRSSADALLTIINDILDFSKIEAGKMDIEIIDFDLRSTVEDALDLFAQKAQEKSLELAGLIYESVPTTMKGDPGRLRQILTNLVGNAIKFTESGEVVVQVVPREEEPTSVILQFDVTDTGMGISSEAKARLFESFSQVDGSVTRKYGGTGLGLAICKRLVELMGGTIGVKSEPGQGSLFWFTIRLEKQPECHTQKHSVSLEGRQVCIVENNDTNRLLLFHYTNSWGMMSVCTENAEDALVILRQMADQGKPCEIAIVNRDMPNMNGAELARRIKADSQLASTRLIILTPIGERGDTMTTREGIPATYLTKPIHHHQLRECITTVLDGSDTMTSLLVTPQTLRKQTLRTGRRILLVDDNMVNQKVSVRMLEKLGYRQEVASNGIEAIQAVEQHSYAAILMDCQMPEMDGFEATAEIRRRETMSMGQETIRQDIAHHPSPYHLPIIAMTANAMKGDREKCLDAGMDDFLSKPVKMDELDRILQQWIGQDSQPERYKQLNIDTNMSLSSAIRKF